MSRWGIDPPDDGAYDDPTNADCADCGTGFWKGEYDSCVWCGPCAQRRDDWATAQEIRHMAKAMLRVDLSKVKDVA